jgi:hypothetical protein
MNSYSTLFENSAQPHDNNPAPDFETMLRASMDELLFNTQQHQDTWRLGKEESWSVDPERAELIFTFPGRVVYAPAQVLGTLHMETGTWLWSWADSSVPDVLQVHALQLRELGEAQGIDRLTNPEWPAAECDCWYLAAFCCSQSGFRGAYRGLSGDSYVFITFGEPVLDPPLEDREALAQNFTRESADDFRENAENPEALRLACCRFFRRGLLIGFSQDELIDFLGLSTPSVLETAGFSAELEQQVMDMVGQISDGEIDAS